MGAGWTASTCTISGPRCCESPGDAWSVYRGGTGATTPVGQPGRARQTHLPVAGGLQTQGAGNELRCPWGSSRRRNSSPRGSASCTRDTRDGVPAAWKSGLTRSSSRLASLPVDWVVWSVSSTQKGLQGMNASLNVQAMRGSNSNACSRLGAVLRKLMPNDGGLSKLTFGLFFTSDWSTLELGVRRNH